MFAIPGICGLIAFILIRPQEFIGAFTRLPMLYLFAGAAMFGFLLDLRLRRLQPRGVPSLPLVIGFVVWVLICNAVKVPDQLVSRGIELAILVVLYVTIAHACQRFRTLQWVTGTIMVSALFIAGVCFHQGFQDRECIEMTGEAEGNSDGRPCDLATVCYLDAPNPAADYRCERAGLFGTNTVEDRVRYRGELHDPNEVALTISIGGLSFLIVFFLRRRTALGTLLGVAGILLVLYTVLLTQSRGGLIVAAAVPGVYFVKRYGVAGLFAAGAAALPMLLLAGGRNVENADMSTQMRYEAWATGLQMFKQSPIFGVGQRQFTDHHWLTAHNTSVLTLAEVGLIGMVLFISILYVSIKSLVVGLRELDNEPGAAVARMWGMAILASMIGLTFQIQTLSFAWHSVLWIFFGVSGAWVSAVRRHRPNFDVRFTFADLGIVTAGCITYAFVVLPLFLKWKGEM